VFGAGSKAWNPVVETKSELSREDALNTNANPMEASRDVLAY
jgi:hypothetical protein